MNMSNVGIGKTFTGVFVAATAMVVAMVVTHSKAPDYDAMGTFRTQAIVVDNKSQLGAIAVPATAMFYAEDDSTTDTTLAWFVTQGTNHVGTGGNNEQIPIVIRNTTNFDTSATNGHATGIDLAVSGGIIAGANPMESIGIAISGHCSTANCSTYSIKSTDVQGVLENDGPVTFTVSPSVQLGNDVQRFTVMPTSPTTTVPQADIGIQAPVDGFALHTKRTDATGSLSGVLAELDTTLIAGARGGFVISRGAGGGAAGNNSGIVVSGGPGYPFTTSAAGDVCVYAEQGALELGADATGFTGATLITPNNHWAEMTSTGLPTLDAGCTSGGGSSIVGNDNRFEVVMGATSITCVITFVKSWGLKPMCSVTPIAAAPGFPNVVPAAATFTFVTNTNGGDYVVDCHGQPGST